MSRECKNTTCKSCNTTHGLKLLTESLPVIHACACVPHAATTRNHMRARSQPRQAHGPHGRFSGHSSKGSASSAMRSNHCSSDSICQPGRTHAHPRHRTQTVRDGARGASSRASQQMRTRQTRPPLHPHAGIYGIWSIHIKCC